MTEYALSKKRALERIFVFQAVEHGYLSQEKLKECIIEHEKREPPVPLLTICKQRQYLTPSQVNHLMSKRMGASFAKGIKEAHQKSVQDIAVPQPAVSAQAEPQIPISENKLRELERLIEDKDRLLEREQKQREFFKRKLEELEKNKQKFWEKKQKEISTLEAELSCYKSLSQQSEQQAKSLKQKLEEKEQLIKREQQKSKSFWNLVEQSGTELREADELRLKAEAELQKKNKEKEFLEEKLKKESSEKNRFKKEVQVSEETIRKFARELENLHAEKGNEEPAAGYSKLTQQLEERDIAEAKLRERATKLREDLQTLKEQHEILKEEYRRETERLKEEHEHEKSVLEEELHKLRISLETDIAQYIQKSEQLESKLKQYEGSFGSMSELEDKQKILERQLLEEREQRKKTEKERVNLEFQIKEMQREIENVQDMFAKGELQVGAKLSGSEGEYYTIGKSLGRGGMGVTYAAQRNSDQKQVVVKTLLPEAMADMKVLMRFVQEAHTILGFEHENLVRGYDFQQGRSLTYFIMEFLAGSSVEDILEEQAMLDIVEATNIILGVSRALDYLETHKLVHRDVKPANIILDHNNVAKLVDFGIVKMTDRTCSLTTEGIILGTPYYLSPEQTYQTNVDIRSDIYSLGATYYHMVVGEVPFPGDNPIDVIQQRLERSPRPGKVKPDLPKDVCKVIEKMMSRNIKKRHRNAKELVAELENVLKKISK